MTNAVEWSVIAMGISILSLSAALGAVVVAMTRRWPKSDGQLASDLVRNLADTYASGLAAGRNEAQNSFLPCADGVASSLSPKNVSDFVSPEEADKPVEVGSF